jgi:hypothetical protein
MNVDATWVAVAATVVVLVMYELLLAWLQHRHPQGVARTAHAGLREDWLMAVSQQRGSEVLAVQTLRNSLMSATMLASTAALALMGTVTLTAPSLRTEFFLSTEAMFTPRLVLELVLLLLLFASLISTLMAVRLYNHAGFIVGMPVDSAARKRWLASGVLYLRRAGVLFGIGLRQLVLVVPVVAALLTPKAGPVAALIVTGLLFLFDRVQLDSAG